ncbi:MAG: hypothetical protein KH112_01155 [Sanguibacteroides justesenii]|uniref:hypothetical protein n=1 Tax=Butyricimonas faecalis TaxID=2093856 RepID=UPI001D63BA1B|nr:hypothetical protein [Sanguibacteroides justesenii]
MKKRWYVLIILMFLTCAIMLNLDLSIQGNSNNNSTLILENIEALGSPESGEGFKYCIQAGGYCFENGIKVKGISMKDE